MSDDEEAQSRRGGDVEEAQSPHSPELGASRSSQSLIPPLEADDSDESVKLKKKRGHKKDQREWKLLAQYQKSDHDPEEIEHKIFEECKKQMEVTRLYRIDSKPAKEHDIFTWKHSNFWSVAKGSVNYQMLCCLMKRRFGCDCQIKICRTSEYVSLEMRGTHDAESHSPEKDTSKFLKVAQIAAIRTGVRIAPKLSAKHLRRNLENSSPEKRIDPALAECVRRKVRKFRSELTSELLDRLAVDDSYGFLVNLVEQRWLPTLLESHNDADTSFHFDMFDVFMIGKDLNPSDDIVYLNMTSLWHLCNWLRGIDAGWILQLNGDVTFKVNRRGVAALTLGVSSLGHVSNPLCWALIPETAESEVTYTGTFRSFQDAVILVLKTYICCGDAECTACGLFQELRESRNVQQFMRTDEYKAGKLHVDATLCDHHLGFHKFTSDEFGFEANTCVNHALGIGAAN
jgi:hypothetical protein